MNEVTQRSLNLFVENRNAVKKVFKWSSPYMHCLCALLLTAQNRAADAALLRESRTALKKDVRFFSSLRGIAMPALITQLSISDDWQRDADDIKSAYRMLREEGFLGTDYLALSAYILARNEGDSRLSRQARELYLSMRAEHKVLTGGDDSGLATLMAVYGIGIEKSTAAYELLKGKFLARNETWLMSHILAFDADNLESNAKRTIELYDCLKADKARFRGMETPILAVVGMLSTDAVTAAREIKELEGELKKRRGFSAWQITNGQRRLYAATLWTLNRLESGGYTDGQRKMFYVTAVTMIVTIVMATIQAASAAAAQ